MRPMDELRWPSAALCFSAFIDAASADRVGAFEDQVLDEMLIRLASELCIVAVDCDVCMLFDIECASIGFIAE